MAVDARKQAIETAIAQIEKQFGKGAIMVMGEARPRLEVSAISTGSVPLDLALGIGGLPRGRVVEIFGPEGCGKTTVALSAVAQAQKNGGAAAFIDAEHALDPTWAQTIGVNLDDLLISQPDTGEQALEIAETLIRSGAVDIVVIDSVAALVPRAEIEGEMGDAIIGIQARLMSQALRKLTGAISKSKTIAIFTNQLREKIGVMFGNPETTPGGRALKFYSSVRIDLRKIENIKDGDKVVGSRIRAKIVKNKVAPPFKLAEFDVMVEEGISAAAGLLDVALDLELVTKSGAFFKWGDKPIGQGREAAKDYFRKNTKEAEKLHAQIFETIKKGTPPKKVEEKEEEEELIPAAA